MNIVKRLVPMLEQNDQKRKDYEQDEGLDEIKYKLFVESIGLVLLTLISVTVYSLYVYDWSLVESTNLGLDIASLIGANVAASSIVLGSVQIIRLRYYLKRELTQAYIMAANTY